MTTLHIFGGILAGLKPRICPDCQQVAFEGEICPCGIDPHPTPESPRNQP